jgi:hypothetical protein
MREWTRETRGKDGKAYTDSEETLQSKRLHGRPSHKWNNGIKADVKATEHEFTTVHNYISSPADQKIATITNNTQQREYQRTCKIEIFKLYRTFHTYLATKNSKPTAALHAQHAIYSELISYCISPKARVTPLQQQRNLSRRAHQDQPNYALFYS